MAEEKIFSSRRFLSGALQFFRAWYRDVVHHLESDVYFDDA